MLHDKMILEMHKKNKMKHTCDNLIGKTRDDQKHIHQRYSHWRATSQTSI